jgi:hypothetical protein
MPETYAREITGVDSVPSTKSDGGLQGGRIRRFRATVDMDGQAIADTVVLADVPPGYAFAYGVITASATLGATATLAIGVSGSAAKYRAAAVLTSANTPTLFGTAAGASADALTDGERVIATVAAAALPDSTGYFVVDLYYSAP